MVARRATGERAAAAMELQLASAMASETERERERMGEQQRGERSAQSLSQSDQRRGEHATNEAPRGVQRPKPVGTTPFS